MITIEQLKDVKERTAALERYLDIENKLVQVEEEQLRTQAPGFWDDAKKAEAQMRKVKDLQKWIDGYREVKTMADELELAFDFCKDDLVTEEEVDAAYQKAVTVLDTLCKEQMPIFYITRITGMEPSVFSKRRFRSSFLFIIAMSDSLTT